MARNKLSYNEGPCPMYDCDYYKDISEMCPHCTNWAYHPDYGTKTIPEGEKATIRSVA